MEDIMPIGAPLSTPPPVRIVIHGAAGRMGARIGALALADRRFALVARVDRAPARSIDAGPAIVSAVDVRAGADVVIDFSSDEGAAGAMSLADRLTASLLVGTTALSPGTLACLRGFSERRGVLVAPNTSLGVAATAWLLARAAELLPGYDASIVDAHHSAKKDAPSGTALRLARAYREAGGTIREDQIVAIRGGDVVGEHTVRLAGPGEYVELTHRATSRDVFAHGALRAAAWLRDRGPGWWTIEDALGLTGR